MTSLSNIFVKCKDTEWPIYFATPDHAYMVPFDAATRESYAHFETRHDGTMYMIPFGTDTKVEIPLLNTCPARATIDTLPINPWQDTRVTLASVLARLASNEPRVRVSLDKVISTYASLVDACRLSAAHSENFQAIGAGTSHQECIYLVDDLRTREQLDTFRSKYGTAAFDTLMVVLAERPSRSCAYSDVCSNLRAQTELGDMLRMWYQTVEAPIHNALVSNICTNNPKWDECACASRSMDPDYKRMKLTSEYSDACWYIPCANPQRYNITKEFETPTCPSSICQIISNFSNTNNIQLEDVSKVIKCGQNSSDNSVPTQISSPLLTKIVLLLALLLSLFFFVKFFTTYK